jgi:hypothetical protein
MNRLCDHFFAGAGFALNQNGGIYGRDHVDLFEHSLEFRTGSNQIETSHRFTPRVMFHLQERLDSSCKVEG